MANDWRFKEDENVEFDWLKPIFAGFFSVQVKFFGISPTKSKELFPLTYWMGADRVFPF